MGNHKVSTQCFSKCKAKQNAFFSGLVNVFGTKPAQMNRMNGFGFVILTLSFLQELSLLPRNCLKVEITKLVNFDKQKIEK